MTKEKKSKQGRPKLTKLGKKATKPGLLGNSNACGPHKKNGQGNPFKEGNQYSVGNKSRTGERKYKYWEVKRKMKAYFKAQDKRGEEMTQYSSRGAEVGNTWMPYTLTGLCMHIGMSTTTFHRYRTAEGYEAYHELFEYAYMMIQERCIEGSMIGKLNPQFSWNYLKNINPVDFKDKKVVEATESKDFSITFKTIENKEQLQLEESKSSIVGEIIEGEIIEEEDNGNPDND